MSLPQTAVLHDAKTGQWLRFSQPVEVIQALQPEDVLPALQRVEAAVTAGLYAAGFIAYEAGGSLMGMPDLTPGPSPNRTEHDLERGEGTPLSTEPTLLHGEGPSRVLDDRVRFPLVWFGLYPPPETIAFPETGEGGYMLGEWQPSVSRAEYDRAIESIKAHIARGDTYQVNYTMRLRAAFAGDPWALFLQLAAAQQAQYAAYVDLGEFAVCSASPELFFTWEAGVLASKPMKGTAARGKRLADDRLQAEWLHQSEKNRAENVMIVDMVRNDIGRVAEIGSVHVPRLFDVERYPTVWQMTSTVEARSTAGLTEILQALFPCASITGAPKIRTMQIIARLENAPRRIYTGCIGFVTPEGRAQFNVAIRTVLVDRTAGSAEYGVGGGIVWDSTSAEEYEECRIKARLLTQKRPAFALFESLLWTPEAGYFLLDAHMRRLAESAEYFGYPLDEDAALNELARLGISLRREAHKVRLLLDRSGVLTGEAAPLSATPLPDPAKVCLALQPVSSENVFLYHKTTHRQAYAQARHGLPAGCEALLWNERGELTEGETANLVVRLDGSLLTPPVECGLLAGTYRAAQLKRGEVEEGIIRLDDLPRCTELWLINSVRGWRRAVLTV